MNLFPLQIDDTHFSLIDEGDGVPVVLLHAGVCDKRMWQAQVKALVTEGYRGIAYDRRGFGETEYDPDEPFSHVDDLADILDALGIGAALLVGCSQGGRIGIDFALKFPQRVIALCLVSSAISGAEFPEDQPVEYDPLIQAYEYADEAGDADMLNKVEAHAWLDGPGEAGGRVGGAVRDLFLDMNVRALAHEKPSEEQEPEPAIDRMHEIEHATLLISGSLDWRYVIERHDWLEAETANAFAVMIDGTAHLPNLEKPDTFNALLTGFLDQLFGDGVDE